MNNTPHRLSAADTFLTKFVVAPVWIAGFALATASLFLSPGMWHEESGGPPDPFMKWLFLGITIVGGLAISRCCFPLKRVRIDNVALYISNYANEITVPLANVASVGSAVWWARDLIKIAFRIETEFGPEIIFRPKARLFRLRSPHPVIGEIQVAVDRATGILRDGAAA